MTSQPVWFTDEHLLPSIEAVYGVAGRVRGVGVHSAAEWHRSQQASTPVPLILGLAVGPIVGGYTGIFLGTESRLIAFSGAVLGIVVMVAIMTFVPSLLALWITRHTGGAAHQTQ